MLTFEFVSHPAGPTAVDRLVRRHVPEAVFLESIGQEITFVLPYSGAADGTFARLFQDLDQAVSDLGLTSYGISDTTLEEVAPPLTTTLSFPPGSRRVRSFTFPPMSTSEQALTPQNFGSIEQKCEAASANFFRAHFLSWNRSSPR